MMNLSLDLGNSTISFDRVLAQLDRFGILPQLIEEIITDDSIEEMNIAVPHLLKLEEKYRQVEILPIYRGMNEHQLRAICDRDLRLQQFKLAMWGSKVESYFQARSRELDRVTLSILQVEEGCLAQELFFRIQSGEQSFAEIALDYSQGSHADNGGILGPILWRELNPGLKKTIEQLQPGELSQLFLLDRYYTFFRLDEYIVAQLDEATYQFILDELFLTWLQSQV
jgi:hypothetical protein